MRYLQYWKYVPEALIAKGFLIAASSSSVTNEGWAMYPALKTEVRLSAKKRTTYYEVDNSQWACLG